MAIPLVPGLAWAAESTDTTLEPVIVTARKRSEDLQHVPISITVLDAKSLAAQGVNTFHDLEYSVPNLAITGPANALGPSVTLRGISSDARNIGFESGLSLYVDGVYTGRPSSYSIDMLDIQQVEVLRGPQGTLFGKNTPAGAINITTVKPSDEVRRTLEFQYGNYNSVVARGVVSGPLVPGVLAAKAGLYYRNRDGFQKNLFNGQDLFTDNSWGGQAELRYTPNAPTEVILSVDGARDHYKPDVNEIQDGGFGATGKPREVNIDAPVFQTRDMFGASLTGNFALDGHALTSITGIRRTDTEFLSDDDASSQPFLTSHFVDKQKQISQEFRVASTSEGPFSYVLGVYLYGQDVDTSRLSYIPPGTLLGPTTVSVLLDASVNTRSYAAFGQFDYRLTPKLTLNGGLRYTTEQKTIDMALLGSPLFGITTLTTRRKRTDDDVSPTLGLSYRITDDVDAYAKVSRGFKSGGYNADFVATPLIDFDPESVTSYEAGLKYQSIPLQLRASLAVFRMDYRDLQIVRFEQFSGFNISNAGRATIDGLEGDITFEPVKGLELTAGLGYLHATFDSYKDGGGPGVNFDGNRLPNAPNWTGNLAAQYRHPLTDAGDLMVRVEYAARSSYFVDPSNDPQSRIAGYGLLNARVGYELADGRWTVELWGKNLTDKLYPNDHGTPVLGGLLGQTSVNYGAPRTYGVRLLARF